MFSLLEHKPSRATCKLPKTPLSKFAKTFFFVPPVMAMTHFHTTDIANARQLLGSSGIGGLLLLK